MIQETAGSRSCAASYSNWPAANVRTPLRYSVELTGAFWKLANNSSRLHS